MTPSVLTYEIIQRLCNSSTHERICMYKLLCTCNFHAFYMCIELVRTLGAYALVVSLY